MATGDINHDGLPDVVAAAGAGGGPEVKVFDGKTNAVLTDFFAFAPTFSNGIFVAVGDVNGDAVPDLIIGAGPGGGPEVRIVDGTKLGMVQANGQISPAALLADFYAFTPAFTGGVHVAAGDVNNDGRADIIIGAGAGGGPEVRVADAKKLAMIQANGQISGSALLDDFFAYNPVFTGGVYVACLEVVDAFQGIIDRIHYIVTGAGAGGGPEVKVISGFVTLQANGEVAPVSLLSDFMAYAPSFTGGVTVAAADVNGDGHADLITGPGPSGGPNVKVFNAYISTSLLDNFMAFDPGFTGGIYVG